MSSDQNGNGHLRQILSEACELSGLAMKHLTILVNDPYRFDTPAGHRDGSWVAEQVARFVEEFSQIHLRGLHYSISSTGNVRKPGGRLYVNSDDDWRWLTEHAARAARWLGYVPFDRISDERNEQAQAFIPEYRAPYPMLIGGSGIELPEIAEDLMPRFHVFFSARQRYRIALITEKASLSPILRPMAEQFGGELIPMTGETSDTRIAELTARFAADGRPGVVLYFADHDPSGWQMPISVSRKLQALRDLLYPNLDIQVRRAALTAEQAAALDLPSTPLKPTEKRADNWKAKTGREQTELDALIALHPQALRRIALKAIAPFFDDTLARRVSQARAEWYRAADGMLAHHPEYKALASRLEEARRAVQSAADDCNALQREAYNVLSSVKPPPVEVPGVQLSGDEIERPLFTTDDDFVTATRRLRAHKELEALE